ncbi:MAG: DUF1848 domain-containing protein [Desulfobacterales bacterium]|nr:DUF1848 domain-containing protein [Desulfobacterales bacterium]
MAKKAEVKKVLSASRRTDIPGWYTPWFLDGINRGYFETTNPFNRQTRRVDVSPETVHTIVFWSKNMGPFLDLNAHHILKNRGFNLFFNFTINSEAPLLEPGIPDLDTRLEQVARLCDAIDPSQIAWRFDPVCFYEKDGALLNNLDGFEPISAALSALGIKRCITSFYDPYKKVDQRIRHLYNPGVIKFRNPDTLSRKKVIRKMAGLLADRKMALFLCCEKELAEALEDVENLAPSACIDGKLYRQLFGGSPETAKDYGQRRGKGCQCTKAVDIGSYQHHPCHHNCLFCYARTGTDTLKGKHK